MVYQPLFYSYTPGSVSFLLFDLVSAMASRCQEERLGFVLYTCALAMHDAMTAISAVDMAASILVAYGVVKGC